MEWYIYENSKIQRLPRMLHTAALVARNLKGLLTEVQHHHRHDGITTRHNDGFQKTEAFQRAHARAVAAAGWDYDIPYRLHQALWCSRTARKVEGDFVELGTGRGFVMSAILADYRDWSSDGRTLHLFDTFIGTYLDKSGKQRSDGPVSPHYATSFEDVQRNFSEWPRVHLHRGDVIKTLPMANLSSVAFLHVDLNFADPEVFGIRQLWPMIPRGGVILL